MIYKYSQLHNKVTDIEYVKYKVLHLGQLKLLLSEILYLTKCASDNNKVVYVGAAAGYHIPLLADMFPNLMFDLWDPGHFGISESRNIKIFNKFFTQSDAKNYRDEGHNILFISDIRNLNIQHLKNDTPAMDKLVMDDMNNQMNWVKTMKPLNAYLKFRLPYTPGKTTYFGGTIYMQIYSPSSTETRILVRDYDSKKIYDNEGFDKTMGYFNCCIRNSKEKNKRWFDIMEKYNLKNNWDSEMALYTIDYYLRKIKKIRSDEEVVKMFINFIDVLGDKNNKKYRPLFIK